ncbi:MAG: ATP-dependent DNA ligase, partial [Bacteroidota bacterium]
MKNFAYLFEQLDETTKTNDRIKALVAYFHASTDEDKLWAVALLGGKRPKRSVPSNWIKDWVVEISGIPMWLFEESYQVVGDMSETISLLLPQQDSNLSEKTLSAWMKEIVSLTTKGEEEKKEFVLQSWKGLNKRERFIFNKLIGGSFRIGISQKNMVKALALFTQKEENDLAHRLMGNWSPQETSFSELIFGENQNVDLSKPYPFYL